MSKLSKIDLDWYWSATGRAESTHVNPFMQLLNPAPGAGFNGRANNLILILRHVQTTKNWLKLLLICYSRAESTRINPFTRPLNPAPGCRGRSVCRFLCHFHFHIDLSIFGGADGTRLIPSFRPLSIKYLGKLWLGRKKGKRGERKERQTYRRGREWLAVVTSFQP